MTDKIVVLSTCGSEDEARNIARKAVESGLAACVTQIPQVRSYYRWKGVTEESAEYLLVIKTVRRHFDALRQLLEAANSYEVPEVIALPVVEGAPNYLAWIENETGGPAIE